MMLSEVSDARQDEGGSVLLMLGTREESRPIRVGELQSHQKSTLLPDAVSRHCEVVSKKVYDVRKANLPRTASGIFQTALAKR